ncbi:hypothetical protein ACJX0J_033442, partial [Zea mays]
VQKEDVNGGADGGNHGLVVSHETHTVSELQAFAPTELMDEHQGMAMDAVLEPMVDNFMVSGTPEMETRAARVERLAAIPETELPSSRKRRSCTTDEHSLARVERLKTERNGGGNGGEIAASIDVISKLYSNRVESSEVKDGNAITATEPETIEEEDEIDPLMLHNLCGEIMEELLDIDFVNNSNWQKSGDPVSLSKPSHGGRSAAATNHRRPSRFPVAVGAPPCSLPRSATVAPGRRRAIAATEESPEPAL